jgi:hypothetical protein
MFPAKIKIGESVKLDRACERLGWGSVGVGRVSPDHFLFVKLLGESSLSTKK